MVRIGDPARSTRKKPYCSLLEGVTSSLPGSRSKKGEQILEGNMGRQVDKFERVALSEIVPYARNSRTHSAEQIKQIQASIREFGFVNPILIDGNKNIIAGHGRVIAAKAEGMQDVPCVLVEHLTEAQKKAYIIADNKLALNAGWDNEMLMAEIEELGAIGFDAEMTGFSGSELRELFKNCDSKDVKEDDFDVGAALEETTEPIAMAGDVYRLGRHRLMCGDSTSAEDVGVLMDGCVADMCFTDPPYNVDYSGGTEDKLKIMNDKMSDDKFHRFLFDAFTNIYASIAAGGAIYICHADSEGTNFRTAMTEAGFLLKQCIIWVKNSLVLGRQDYQWQHEPILYGWKPGAAHKWFGGRKQTTVFRAEDGIFATENDDKTWTISMNVGIQNVTIRVPKYEIISDSDSGATSIWKVDKPTRNGEHPTMKPIKLCATAIRNSTGAGGSVLDLFAGSGSSLIACEETGRKCYCMEMDPRYVDVIIKRWEKLTNEKAVKL